VLGVCQPLIQDDALRAVLTAHASALRELHGLQGPRWSCAVSRVTDVMTGPLPEALLSAAPQLRVCEADALQCRDDAAARRALRNEGVFGPQRTRTAWLSLWIQQQRTPR
jgi:hypothetical protein